MQAGNTEQLLVLPKYVLGTPFLYPFSGNRIHREKLNILMHSCFFKVLCAKRHLWNNKKNEFTHCTKENALVLISFHSFKIND